MSNLKKDTPRGPKTRVEFSIGQTIDKLPEKVAIRNSKYAQLITSIPETGYLQIIVNSGKPSAVASTIKATAKKGGVSIDAMAVDNVVYLSRSKSA